MRLTKFFMVMILISIFSSLPLMATVNQSTHSKLDQTIQRYMNHWGATGLVISAVHKGKTVYLKGYGSTKVEGGVPANGQTMTQVMSISKSFTAAALGMLVEEKKIAWDDPVKKYIPEFEFGDPYLTEHITVLDLMMHRTGVPKDLGGPTFWDSVTNLHYTMEDLLTELKGMKPVIDHRTGVFYSNAGIGILGELLKRATGMSWADFIKKRIFDPLDMKRSYPGAQLMSEALGSPDEIENLMKPTDIVNGLPVDSQWRWLNPIYWPPAGIVTTAEDMTRFLIMITEGGVFQNRRILRKDSIKTMFTPMEIKAFGLIVDVLPIISPLGKLAAFSPGWYCQEYAGRLIFEHGGAGAASTVAAVVPEERFGVFIATNMIDTQFIGSWKMISAMKFAVIEYFLSIPPTDWISVLDNQGSETDRNSGK
jgi:CubicO group peptidase (beta-lactamase class C family)